MRFGAFVPQGWRWDLVGIPKAEHWKIISDRAALIERSGFESLWVYDHFHNWPQGWWREHREARAAGESTDDMPEPVTDVTYEAWTMMAALGAVTSTVRLGQMCTCNTYRPPAYLAKVAATIDVFTGGRVEMGIGAGWYEEEHDGYGYPFLPPPGRLGMLREGVEIMKAMWTRDVVDYEGKHYRLKGGMCDPKPVQQPHIPVWVAGGGEQVTLRIAARHADYTNFGIEIEAFRHKSEILRSHCDDLGTDFDRIVRSANFNIMVGDTEAEVEDKITWLADHLAQVMPSPRAHRFADGYRPWSGTPEQVVEKLRQWEAEGMTYAIVNFADLAYDTSSLELFASKVLPELR
ncbi:MAG TPA: TIGR03560 family F420-dependent LLM class oxidoreductase [Acidimicrobiia bacterium]